MKKAYKIIIWLFIVSLFLRIFQLDHFISYHQDQVRDLFYVKQHFEQGKLILLGPKASVGNFFLPPFWYYLMSIAYVFSKSPLAPAALTAILSSFGTVIIFVLVKDFFDEKMAFPAAILYAVSPLSIEYSRFAWNPNPIPFFVLLTFFFLYRFLFKKDESSFYWGTVSANLAFQLHYQGLVIFIFYFLAVLLTKKLNIRKFIYYLIINFLLVSPFLIYELQNHFQNTLGIVAFLLKSQAVNKLKLFGIPFFVKFIFNEFSFFLARVMFFKNQILGYASLFVLFISLFISLLKFSKLPKPHQILNWFLLFSFAMLFFYKNSLIDFYLLFLIPVVIVYFVTTFKTYVGYKASFVLISVVVLINLYKSPAFGNFDSTYLWASRSIDKITDQKNYCLSYNIFPQNFIESKYRYMMTLAKNQPTYQNCDNIMFYRCDPKVKVGYYICENALCPQKPVDFTREKLIDMKPYESNVKIYQLTF